MTKINQNVLNFLLSRRSHASKSLSNPIPNDDEIELILTAAARSPDHGNLEPWRFIIIKEKDMNQICEEIQKIGQLKGINQYKLDKNCLSFKNAALIVAVICSPKESEKIPVIEQHLSAGAVCLSLLNAAHACGWGANWITGWLAHDSNFVVSALGLDLTEFVAGFVHIGTPKYAPQERDRPNVRELMSQIKC